MSHYFSVVELKHRLEHNHICAGKCSFVEKAVLKSWTFTHSGHIMLSKATKEISLLKLFRFGNSHRGAKVLQERNKTKKKKKHVVTIMGLRWRDRCQPVIAPPTYSSLAT